MISHRVQKRLTHEVHEALALRDKRGQSKHKDKQAARKAAQDNHTAYKTITGLYATTSLTTYARQAKTALCWIAERYGCRNLAECKEHLPAYYADMIARNLSAWTIRTRVYALCAVYAQPYQELFGVESLPIRHRADITRGRTLSAMYGDAWRGEWECLFVGDDGTPLNPSTINEWLDKLTERNGLPHVTVHSLRHLCATLLIRTHADPKTVQTILRHANVSTTLNIYAKVFDSTQMEAIGRVQASLENMLKESCSSSAQV